jgi:hypothetical protein
MATKRQPRSALVIRRAGLDEKAEVARLLNLVYGGAPYSTTERTLWENEMAERSSDNTFLFAERGKRIVAYASLKKNSIFTPPLGGVPNSMCLLLDVGAADGKESTATIKELVKASVEKAKEKRAAVIHVHILPKDAGMVGIYTEQGFRAVQGWQAGSMLLMIKVISAQMSGEY